MTDTNFSLDHEETEVFVSISPCSWMYPNYGLQISLSLREHAANVACEFICDKTVNYKDLKSPVAVAFKMATAWLNANGLLALQTQLKKEAEILEEYKKLEAKEQKRLDALKAKHKAQGFTHQMTYVIHSNSGSDRVYDAFFKGEPTKADIAQLLKKSVVKDDYAIRAL